MSLIRRDVTVKYVISYELNLFHKIYIRFSQGVTGGCQVCFDLWYWVFKHKLCSNRNKTINLNDNDLIFFFLINDHGYRCRFLIKVFIHFLTKWWIYFDNILSKDASFPSSKYFVREDIR